MSVALRLRRKGKTKDPYFDIVATDSRSPRDGKVIEVVGSYDPNFTPPKVEVKSERFEHWLKVGAIPSETVASLVKRASAAKAQA